MLLNHVWLLLESRHVDLCRVYEISIRRQLVRISIHPKLHLYQRPPHIYTPSCCTSNTKDRSSTSSSRPKQISTTSITESSMHLRSLTGRDDHFDVKCVQPCQATFFSVKLVNCLVYRNRSSFSLTISISP